MKKKRYTPEQIVEILQEADKADGTVGEICRRYEVAEATFYRWRKTYRGMSTPEVRRLRELEQENARLKKLVAERDLELDAMKDVLAKNG